MSHSIILIRSKVIQDTEVDLALIGYARVSSVGQSLDVQLDKLQHCDKIFQEKVSSLASNMSVMAIHSS